jgi:hypothetical protein
MVSTPQALAATASASLGAANSVPQVNRSTGPKIAAAWMPVKYRPGTDD